jgi:hypothetical protein
MIRGDLCADWSVQQIGERRDFMEGYELLYRDALFHERLQHTLALIYLPVNPMIARATRVALAQAVDRFVTRHPL